MALKLGGLDVSGMSRLSRPLVEDKPMVYFLSFSTWLHKDQECGQVFFLLQCNKCLLQCNATSVPVYHFKAEFLEFLIIATVFSRFYFYS